MSLTSQSRETPPCHTCQRLIRHEQAREDKVLTWPPDSTDPSTTEHLQDVPEQAKSTETADLQHKEPQQIQCELPAVRHFDTFVPRQVRSGGTGRRLIGVYYRNRVIIY